MEVVKIEWIDSCASDLNWCLIENLAKLEPIRIVSYGVLVQESEDNITIAQNFGFNPHQCCSLMTIPKGCIKTRTIIETMED